jgi:hypothetical protein
VQKPETCCPSRSTPKRNRTDDNPGSPPAGIALNGSPPARLAGATLAAAPSSHSLANLAAAADDAPPRLAAAAAAGAAAAAAAGGVRLSVLYPDGSVNDRVQKGTVLAAVMTGDMELAITGKGFDALLESPDPEVVQPVLRRGAVFARMSPDNKRDLMHLLGGGLEAAPAARPLGLHVGGSRGRGGARPGGWGWLENGSAECG